MAFSDFFKSRKQQEIEQRMAWRKSARAIEAAVRAVGKQREKYLTIGRAAARNGSAPKVRQAALALRQCNQLEARMSSALTAIDLLQTQQDIGSAQQVFIQAMREAHGIISTANLPAAALGLRASLDEAEAAQADIEAITEELMHGSLAGPASATEIAALEAELNAAMEERPLPTATTQQEKAPTATQGIDDDLKALEKELNLNL